ncbi:hypothetical protein [Mesorhizobium sp.]|uniref:hypothetical protein n=1 Tax=Mesorhizobium sp. TaxID=1871066 RepID=UPI0025EB27E2|nr:hypothetical protein [Mesorhizobium sp.]
MIRLGIVLAAVFIAILAALFELSAAIATAIGHPESTHLFAILIIACTMIFSAVVVSAVDRGWNPFK